MDQQFRSYEEVQVVLTRDPIGAIKLKKSSSDDDQYFQIQSVFYSKDLNLEEKWRKQSCIRNISH